MNAFNIPAGLSAFDEAVAAELPCVSTLEYNSHKICKWFAKNIRERLAAAPPVDAVVGEPVAWWRVSYVAEDGSSDADVQIGSARPDHMGDNGFPWQPLYATPAVSRAEGLEPVFYLDEEMAGLLRQTIGDDGELNAIKLHIGDGHSGHGLYVSLSDYPEEGAIQLVESPAIAPAALAALTSHRSAEAADDLRKLRFVHRVLGNFAHAPQSDRADAYAMVRELIESYWKAGRASPAAIDAARSALRAALESRKS